MKVLRHFATENATRRLDIVQNISCLILRHFVQKYVLEISCNVVIENILIYLEQNELENIRTV